MEAIRFHHSLIFDFTVHNKWEESRGGRQEDYRGEGSGATWHLLQPGDPGPVLQYPRAAGLLKDSAFPISVFLCVSLSPCLLYRVYIYICIWILYVKGKFCYLSYGVSFLKGKILCIYLYIFFEKACRRGSVAKSAISALLSPL